MSSKNGFTPEPTVLDFMKVNKLHHCCVDSGIKALGLGLHCNQHTMLMYLNRSENTISQKDIAKHYDVSAAAVAGALKSLENDGYIKRAVDSADTRRNIVEITPKGEEIILQSERVFAYVDNKMIEGIDEEELKILDKCLKKMSDNLLKIMKEKEEKQ